MTGKSIRIGNAGGYWGDDPSALARQIQGGPLDYITMDFLAEITMSILQKQRARDPEMGYAKDFIKMLDEVLPDLLDKKIKLITNAGGINPKSCAREIHNLAKSKGLNIKIAVIDGDDIMTNIDSLESQGETFTNMETSECFSKVKDSIISANVYFGVAPVAEALKWDPDIIITGRVTDTGITLAPMVHEFNWPLDDWDRLASGIIAGHMLECGTQITGGNFTDWEKVDSFSHVGFPIAEINADGSFVLTKHQNTGGLVNVNTVREQLFYEMGNPEAYITPDVIADFTTIQLKADGENRVKASGIKGYAPTPLYKVSMAFEDGFKAQGTIIISGPNARKKAEAFAKIFWERCGSDFDHTETEFFGFNACQRSLVNKDDANEILLRVGVLSSDQRKLRNFSKLVPSLILSGPPGVAVTGGVPRPQQVVSYWPALINKDTVHPKISLIVNGEITDEQVIKTTATGNFEPQSSNVQVAETPSGPAGKDHDEKLVPISSIALGRSGDKGDMCNVGVLARSPKAFEFLDEWLTAQRVKNYFQELCFGPVTRYKLSNLQGFNFLLDEALGGGGTKTLRFDAQGKTFAQGLLAQKIKIPQEVLDDVAAKDGSL